MVVFFLPNKPPEPSNKKEKSSLTHEKLRIKGVKVLLYKSYLKTRIFCTQF